MRIAMLEWGPGKIEMRIARANDICDHRFNFLNVSREFRSIPWNETPVSHLWSFNLHYFDYALDLAWAFQQTGNQRYLRRFEELVKDWERATRLGGSGGDAWNPYAVSVRAINWSYVLVLVGDSLDPDFRRQLTDSLHRQIVFLSSRLEWHLLGNHLLRNLQAIALAGLLFEGSARSWLEDGTAQLWRELDEQFLPDGGHFERSPMYQAIALGDLLELLVLRMRSGLETASPALDSARKMIIALNCMSRDDGGLRLFNDSANGIAPPLSHLNRLAALIFGNEPEVDREQWELRDTGYFGARQGKFELMLDCGAVGARYQPGHAHCDILSYELDYDGNRFVVDSGVSGYEGDSFREYARSTRAHNTLMIDGNEQSEVWGTFRVARRAMVSEARPDHRERSEFVFYGGYRPYRQPGASHSRTFRLTESHLQIVDRVRGADGAAITSFVHLHPDCLVEAIEQGFRISRLNRTLILSHVGFDTARLLRGETRPAQGWFLPEFGKSIPNVALELGIATNDGREFGYTIEAE
jgi:uncharacterized heparinase superfamily protein